MLLRAIVHGVWYQALLRVRAAIEECGSIYEEHAFSELMVSFRVELERAHLAHLVEAMRARGVELDEPSIAALDAESSRVGTPTVAAMLSVTFAEGDPNVRRVVPDVPG